MGWRLCGLGVLVGVALGCGVFAAVIRIVFAIPAVHRRGHVR